MFDYAGRPECQTYIGRAPRSADDLRSFVTARQADADSLVCAIEVAGRVVGDIGGRRVRPGSLGPEPEVWDFTVGYSVSPDVAGTGVATAAVRLLVSALHEQAGIRRVTATVFTENAASLRVLEKNGFRLEGTERAAVLGRDVRWLDDSTLAHLPSDPLPAP